jgi:peroxiredoxin
MTMASLLVLASTFSGAAWAQAPGDEEGAGGKVAMEDSPAAPQVAGEVTPERVVQRQNFNLPCLAPILKGIDAEVPLTLDQALLSASVRKASTEMPGIGAEAVSFPISTDNDELQRLFNRGVALLHSFWYREAQQAFRHAHSLDPKHPMPLWGLAWANERRPERARLFAHQALLQMRGPISEREREWLLALGNYFQVDRENALADTPVVIGDAESRSRQHVRDLEHIATKFPEDLEARAFLIRELVTARHRSGVSPGSYLAVQKLAEELLAKAPGHPAAVYPILLWLDEQPDQALRAAETMNSPGVADAWRYVAEAHLLAGHSASAVELLEAALRIDHSYLAEHLLTPDQSQSLLDNHAQLVRVLAGMGRIEEALARCLELLRFPERAAAMVAAGSNRPPPPTGRSIGLQLYAETLARAGQWQRLRDDLADVRGLQPGDLALPQAHWIFWMAMAELHLNADSKMLPMWRKDLAALAGKSAPSQAVVDEVGHLSAALFEAQRLVTGIEATGSSLSENLAKFLPLEALARLLFDAGEKEAALEAVVAARELQPGGFLPTATSIAMLNAAGDRGKAMYAFDRDFRAVASFADKNLADLENELLTVAESMQLGEQWRLSAAEVEVKILPEDPAVLGPSIWQPNPVPLFRLPNHAGREIALSDYHGRPVLVNFFLGVGCVFCARQLDLFRPQLKRFREAGIEFVAISTDSVETLQQVLGSDEESAAEIAERFPFPMLSDADGKTFNAYGVVDDYGIGGMHATFLISSDGRILWQDISRLPFEQPDDLLREARRLLELQEQDGLDARGEVRDE